LYESGKFFKLKRS